MGLHSIGTKYALQDFGGMVLEHLQKYLEVCPDQVYGEVCPGQVYGAVSAHSTPSYIRKTHLALILYLSSVKILNKE
jgi:hypothetical protein